MSSSWLRESTFAALLADCSVKPSESKLRELAAVAVDDEARCYKAVAAQLERHFKRAHGRSQLHVLYAASEVLRQSRRQLGSKDRYGV